MEAVFEASRWVFAVGVGGVIAYVLRMLYIKVDKSISREEAVDMIEVRLKPLKESQERSEAMIQTLLDHTLKGK